MIVMTWLTQYCFGKTIILYLYTTNKFTTCNHYWFWWSCVNSSLGLSNNEGHRKTCKTISAQPSPFQHVYIPKCQNSWHYSSCILAYLEKCFRNMMCNQCKYIPMFPLTLKSCCHKGSLNMQSLNHSYHMSGYMTNGCCTAMIQDVWNTA